MTALVSDAPRVDLAFRFIDAFNLGDRTTLLSLLSDDPAVSDCDYVAAADVEFRGRDQVSQWIAARIADHDHLTIERVENGNQDPSSAAIGVTFARRRSDSLRALGFSSIRPKSSAKIRFVGSGDGLRVETFANGPGGGPSNLCAPATADATPATCASSTPIFNGDEVQGVATDASVYGLLFLAHSLPIRSGEDVKIVWRMTGNGDLSVTTTSPSNRPGVLTFGPELHTGSNFNRPGDEWGTGFKFDEAGCWHIHLQRTVGAGDVWIDVAPSAP